MFICAICAILILNSLVLHQFIDKLQLQPHFMQHLYRLLIELFAKLIRVLIPKDVDRTFA